jgi:hypothetical protein
MGPAAAAAVAVRCSSRPPSSQSRPGEARITGTIVGASHATGHRLRDDDFPPPTETHDVSVVIVGGGMAGLSAAWKLSKSGFEDYALLELEAEAGGNSRSGRNDVSAYPWGAHYLPVPPPEAPAVRELLEEMGMVQSYGVDGEPVYDPRHLCHAPQERVFMDGAWRDGLSARDLLDPEGTGNVAVLDEFEAQVQTYRNYRDALGRRAFAIPVAASTTDAEIVALDEISMRDYLDRAGWSSDTLRWYVDYCCRDDYGCTLDTTSAWAGWHYFCSRPAEGQYLTWPEGNGRIVQHVLNRVAQQVRTGMLVYRVGTGDAGAERPATGGIAQPGLVTGGIDVDAVDTVSGTAVRYRARRAIYALPRFTAHHVIEGYAPPEAPDAFTYCPWMVANLTVSGLPVGAAWDNVLYDSASLGYVVATHQNLSIAPGPSVLTYYRPLSVPNPTVARTWMLDQTWDDWVALVLADLSQAHPEIESLVTHVDVMLWGHAMIRPVPGFVWGASRRRAEAPHGAIRFAHSDMSGVSIFEEAQYHGVRAAEAVMRDLGHAHTSSV